MRRFLVGLFVLGYLSGLGNLVGLGHLFGVHRGGYTLDFGYRMKCEVRDESRIESPVCLLFIIRVRAIRRCNQGHRRCNRKHLAGAQCGLLRQYTASPNKSLLIRPFVSAKR